MLRLIFLLYCSNALSVPRKQSLPDISKYSIQMIGYSPIQNDEYVAVSREAPEGYIVSFEPMAHADRVHHMLLFGCTEPAFSSNFWKGAPNLILPNNVAFSIGHKSDGIRYLILQVHYAQPFLGDVKDFSGIILYLSQTKPQNLAAVLLFVSGEPVPPRKEQVQINISCEYNGETELHPFAFRTHTHAMGRVVSAYYKHDGQWNKIGSRNPQWPQLFELIPNIPIIRKGDLMAASCRFDSRNKINTTPMGSMGTNEMCNFYMMFYWDSTKDNPFPWGASSILFFPAALQNEMRNEYPEMGTQLLPTRPDLEHHAHQSKVSFFFFERLRNACWLAKYPLFFHGTFIFLALTPHSLL
ncbi:copper type II ascorbate-dependent monooxygenase domain protein [Dictyocaulus viviparus]|uniref:Copper type II ascorbate-dependent monooxygenase domain protein n=1 Tax=Dictyocaulus viviparus TaxID=29172 RepID=A0A0D8XQ89_DICVI|nr:copper type II ascorbate-dependent monooxygenase domain protein [Dictyocaulus viviparus]